MKVTRLVALGEIHTNFDKKNFDKKFLDLLCEGYYNQKKKIKLKNTKLFLIFFFNLLNNCQKNRLCVNSNAFPTIMDNGKFEQIGNKTECSLLELAFEFDYNYKNYRPSDKVNSIFGYYL